MLGITRKNARKIELADILKPLPSLDILSNWDVVGLVRLRLKYSTNTNKFNWENLRD